MLQDVLKGKHTEIDFINGAVVKRGESYGVDVTMNKVMVGLVGSLPKKEND